MPSRSARPARPATTLHAYVLHRYDWSESSLILDLWTREQGRLAVAARGAKRPYSQLRPVLMPFQRLAVTLGRPRPMADGGDGPAPEVQTLRGAEWAGGDATVLGAAGLFSGFYCNELLMKLLARHDPHPRLFDAYAETLPHLAADDAAAQRAIRSFELVLLREIGLLPDLSRVTPTQVPVAEGDRLTLLAEHGVTTPAIGETGLAGGALIGLQAALDHGSMAALRQACGEVLPELRGLLRSLLAYHLGTTMLRTRQVLASVQNL